MLTESAEHVAEAEPDRGIGEGSGSGDADEDDVAVPGDNDAAITGTKLRVPAG